MIKDYLTKGFWYFVYLVICLWVSMVIVMSSVLITRFVFPADSLSESICSTILMSVTMMVGMFLLSHRWAYRESSFRLKKIFVPLAIAFMLQLLYACVFSFSVFTSGPAYWLGDIVSILKNNAAPGVDSKYVLPNLFIYDVLYGGVVISGEYLGAKKRNRDRSKLFAEHRNTHGIHK